MSLWPSGFDFENLVSAWRTREIGHYFFNTVKIAVGSWLVQLFVAVTGGYVLGVLRPWYARILTGAVLVTLFVPPVVLLVPLFLTVLDLPIAGTSLLNSYWGVWLPAGASAFNVILVKRFMENLPKEIIEAARVDGAGPIRLLWSIVLPLSKPVIGVVSVFAVLLTWKDYLWPLGRAPRPGDPAALGAPAARSRHVATRRFPRRPGDLDGAADHAVHHLPPILHRRRSDGRGAQRLSDRAPRAISATLRTTCHHDNGAAESAPKHAHGG